MSKSGAEWPGDPDALGRRLVTEHTIWSTVVGSLAFGLTTEESDVDRRGVFLAPTPLFWSLRKPPTHVDGPGPERFSWEVERFCQLALRANPNALEVLYSPLVETSTPPPRHCPRRRTPRPCAWLVSVRRRSAVDSV